MRGGGERGDAATGSCSSRPSKGCGGLHSFMSPDRAFNREVERDRGSKGMGGRRNRQRERHRVSSGHGGHWAAKKASMDLRPRSRDDCLCSSHFFQNDDE